MAILDVLQQLPSYAGMGNCFAEARDIARDNLRPDVLAAITLRCIADPDGGFDDAQAFLEQEAVFELLTRLTGVVAETAATEPEALAWLAAGVPDDSIATARARRHLGAGLARFASAYPGAASAKVIAEIDAANPALLLPLQVQRYLGASQFPSVQEISRAYEGVL